MHTQQDLKDIVQILRDQLDDLQTWSVYNDDRFSDQISDIEAALDYMEGHTSGL